MPSRRRALLILLMLACGAGGALVWALAVGSLPLRLAQVWGGLSGSGDDPLVAQVVWQLRVPRALSALACGGLLALSGALMQILLRNPLADPYVLGVSGGAAVGALAALFLGLPLMWLQGSAFVGALAVMLLVFGLAHGDGAWTQTRLLLTGVMVASGCGAAVTLLLAMAPDRALRGMLFWLMGDVSQAASPLPALLILTLALLILLPFARDLNLLARGELAARSLGVPVDRLRYLVYGLASLLTAVAVTLAGSIGFVGLVVPHLMRLALGNDQRLLLPASALAGGALLTVADTLARSVIAPQQLPVGVLTALIGVPAFLYLLARQSGGGR